MFMAFLCYMQWASLMRNEYMITMNTNLFSKPLLHIEALCSLFQKKILTEIEGAD